MIIKKLKLLFTQFLKLKQNGGEKMGKKKSKNIKLNNNAKKTKKNF